MSTQIFPSLSGLGWSVTRTPLWKSRVQEVISGKETRIAYWSCPRWQWEMSFDFLRQAGANQQASGFVGASYGEFAELAGFFNARQGQFDTFLYQDPDDNTVLGQAIGIGDGSTTSFALMRAFGNFVEPVLAPSALAAAYIGGVPVPGSGLSAPPAPATSAAPGGAISATTYYVRTTLVTPAGETPASSEVSQAAASNMLLTVSSPALAQNATGWNVYVATTAGNETRQNAVPIPLGSAWTEPASGIVAGVATPLTSNSCAISHWGAASPGVLSFATAPASGAVISADFSYYFPCRFTIDNLTFEKFMAALYSTKKLTFVSVKN